MDPWNEDANFGTSEAGDESVTGDWFGEDDLPVPREQADPWEDAETDPKGAAARNASAPDPWLRARLGTVRDVAGMFGVHWKTVEIWRRKLGLPFVRIGGVIRYVFSDVSRWASARKEGV